MRFVNSPLKTLAALTAVFLATILFLSCGDVKLNATGQADEIIVFADSLVWQALQPVVSEVFQDTIYTPLPEPWFTLRREPFERYSEFETHKNRIVLGTLDGQGPVSDFIRASLAPEVRTMVEQGKEYVFNKYDSKRRFQLLMFLVGTDTLSLRSAMKTRAVDLLYYFRKLALERERELIGEDRKYHKQDIEWRLLESYGWTMWVQNDYFVARDSAQSNFVWLRRANPSDIERWIFVHWIDNFDPKMLNEKFVYRLRDSLTQKFMRTVSDSEWVEIAPFNLVTERETFLNRFALVTRGNWRFSDKSGGGPFLNYSMYDDSSRRFYMLDASIFAPRVTKRNLLLQVDALLHTFRTVRELSAEERKKLKSEAEEKLEKSRS